MLSNKLSLADYEGMRAEDAFRDFLTRIEQYERTYVPVQSDEGSYVKVVDAGRQVITNRIEGYLSSRLAFFLMQIRPTDRPICLTRHGESESNLTGRIGGDSPLTPRGLEYSRSLATFIQSRISNPVVWTSALQRTVATAALLGQDVMALRALNEIDAGVCDGWTYEEIKTRLPEEYAARGKNKFRYRYPRGESYADVVQRLEPVILELEGLRTPVLIVAHQAVLRALYGYLMGKPQDECPYLSVPLHTVIQLTPTETGYEESRFVL